MISFKQQDDDSKEEGGVKKVEECLSVMPQTVSSGDRRHSQVSLEGGSHLCICHLYIYIRAREIVGFAGSGPIFES